MRGEKATINQIKDLNSTLYDVQVDAVYKMLKGNIVNVETGEGKTRIIYTLAVIKVERGDSVVVLTPNDYLNKRDYLECKQFIKESKLDISVSLNGESTDKNIESKREIYKADIIYSTVSEFVFDYLREMDDVDFTTNLLNRSLIIDEIDQILVDNSNTNFTVSLGEGSPISIDEYNLYLFANQLVKSFKGGELTCVLQKSDLVNDDGYDFVYSYVEKFVYITTRGEQKIRQLIQDESDKPLDLDLYSAILNILRANYLMHKGIDYIVKDGEISIIDINNGRYKENNHYSSAYHLSLEIKEGLNISKVTNRSRSINGLFFFSQFKDLTGCSGTAWESRRVFKKILNKDTLKIKRNKPALIIEHPHIIFKTKKDKYEHVINKVKELKEKGLPILVVARNDIECVKFHNLLRERGIDSLRLTNKDLEKEFEIVERSGVGGSILTSTLISGRGTDIKIDEYISNIGGLQVIFLTRFENVRAETQIIGRTGRQGNYGGIYFYSSLDDYIYQYLGVKKKNKLIKLVKRGVTRGRKIDRFVRDIQRMFSGNMVDSITGLYVRNAITHFAETYALQHGLSDEDLELISHEVNNILVGLPVSYEPFISNTVIKVRNHLDVLLGGMHDGR